MPVRGRDAHATFSGGPSHRRYTRGFTLIELLAATALAAVLLVASLAVVRSIGRAAPAAGDLGRDWTGALRRQVRWDLANAVVYRQDARGLVLAGYGSLDPTTLAPTHQPVTVTYTLRPVGEQLWLVREQTALDPLMVGGSWSELVCGGVRSFHVRAPPPPPPVDPQQVSEDPTPLPFQRLANMSPIPDSMRVTVEATGQRGASAMDETLFLR